VAQLLRGLGGMKRLRVATLQYFIRPVRSYEEFADQVSALVATAHDYKCRLVVFPEYFTVQLLTLGDIKRPMDVQIRDLARQAERNIELLKGLAQQYGIYICGGTMPVGEGDDVFNECYFFGPTGNYAAQGKLHMTQFEKREWLVKPRSGLEIFDTDHGTMAIAICYDVEFPEMIRAAAREGAEFILVPSCTDDRQGFLRVRYCAHARAIENQIYVIHSSTVGSLPMVPAVSLNYGQSSILTPNDYAFARDGILAEGVPNQEMMVIGELDPNLLYEHRTTGTVLPLEDSQNTLAQIQRIGRISL
jgi:predicted amidohydrolase